MKSAGNRGIIQCYLQMLHIHVFLVALLGAGHMTQSCADQHQSNVIFGECPYQTCPLTNLAGQSFTHVVGLDARLILNWERAIGSVFSFIAAQEVRLLGKCIKWTLILTTPYLMDDMVYKNLNLPLFRDFQAQNLYTFV